MAKKDFTEGLADAFIQKAITPQPTKQPTEQPKPSPIVDINTYIHHEEVKITFMLEKTLDEKLRYICIKEHKKLKQIIADALQRHVAAWEKKNGAIL